MRVRAIGAWFAPYLILRAEQKPRVLEALVQLSSQPPRASRKHGHESHIPRSPPTLRLVGWGLIACLAVRAADAATRTPKPGSAPASSSASRPGTPRIALIMKSLANEFFKTMAEGARKHQAEHSSEYELIVNGIKDERDLKRQVDLVEEMVGQRVDAIVIAPADSKALVSACKRAQEAGIVVINIDNKLDDEVLAEQQRQGAVRRPRQPGRGEAGWRLPREQAEGRRQGGDARGHQDRLQRPAAQARLRRGHEGRGDHDRRLPECPLGDRAGQQDRLRHARRAPRAQGALVSSGSFTMLRGCGAAGVAIIYISHRLEEVRRIAERITVPRDGRLVATRPASRLDLDEAVHLMVGTNPENELHPHARPSGPACSGSSVSAVASGSAR